MSTCHACGGRGFFGEEFSMYARSCDCCKGTGAERIAQAKRPAIEAVEALRDKVVETARAWRLSILYRQRLSGSGSEEEYGAALERSQVARREADAAIDALIAAEAGA